MFNICEFIMPYEDDLIVAFIGDNFKQTTIDEFNSSINQLRREINLHKHIDYVISTSQLFHGEFTNLFTNKNILYVFDEFTSETVIASLCGFPIDPIEDMLLNKYVISNNIDKFILSLGKTSKIEIDAFIKNIDHKQTDVNYLIQNNYMGIHVFNPSEFSNVFVD